MCASSWLLKTGAQPYHVLPNTGQLGVYSLAFMGSHVCAEGHQSVVQTSLRMTQNLNFKLPTAGCQKQYQRVTSTDNVKGTGEASKKERVSQEQVKHCCFHLSPLLFL